MQLEIAILIIFGIWLSILTFILYLYLNFFNRLAKGVAAGNLKKVLDSILTTEAANTKDIQNVRGELEALEKSSIYHFQKLGLVRYNPFKDLGGDHSFSLAILDGEENGMIITSLHTRERTRIYMKLVKAGKNEFQLSAEEKEALARAGASKK